MLAIPQNLSLYFCDRPIDFRNSFNGLCGEVRNYLKQNPTNGSLFIFHNKSRDKLKLLIWDNDGFWIFYKRLEKGTFEIPKKTITTGAIELTHTELLCILSGIEIGSIKARKRYKKAS